MRNFSMQTQKLIKQAKYRLMYWGRYKSRKLMLDHEQINQLNHLKQFGYVMLPHVLTEDEFAQMKFSYQLELEEKLNFETPCLAQNKIDSVKHKILLDNYLCYTPQQYLERGIAFTKSEVSSYQQVLDEFRPSTLKTYIPQSHLFFNVWLHPTLLTMVEAYMGLRPYLVEAYLRRNFPSEHKVMNHFWHRDSNHPDYLLKAFIFLSDCEVHHGPHQYIAGSIQDQRLSGKPYYSDEEVDNFYPQGHDSRITSIVKAGTIILEDTRGLHRAVVPERGFRDLGYAIFMPRNTFYRRGEPYFTVDQNTYHQLNSRQQSYMMPEYIFKGD